MKKLKKLTCFLIDCLCELTTEKYLLNNRINIFQDEKIVLTNQISDLEAKVLALIAKTNELLNLIESESRFDVKLNGKISKMNLS